MTSPNPSHAEEMTHRLSVKIFGEEMPRSNPLNSYCYKILTTRILIMNKITSQQYYPSQLHIDPNYNPQITFFSAGQGSTSFTSSFQYPSSCNQYPPSFQYLLSSQYNTDTTISGGLPSLHPTSMECSTPTPTQASRNLRSNPELTREGRELSQLMMHLGGAITNKL
jgi:hypothetical protein